MKNEKNFTVVTVPNDLNTNNWEGHSQGTGKFFASEQEAWAYIEACKREDRKARQEGEYINYGYNVVNLK